MEVQKSTEHTPAQTSTPLLKLRPHREHKKQVVKHEDQNHNYVVPFLPEPVNPNSHTNDTRLRNNPNSMIHLQRIKIMIIMMVEIIIIIPVSKPDAYDVHGKYSHYELGVREKMYDSHVIVR